MKNVQKLVLVPIEKWEKIRAKKRTCKRSFSENSSSEESIASNESTSEESLTSNESAREESTWSGNSDDII